MGVEVGITIIDVVLDVVLDVRCEGGWLNQGLGSGEETGVGFVAGVVRVRVVLCRVRKERISIRFDVECWVGKCNAMQCTVFLG